MIAWVRAHSLSGNSMRLALRYRVLGKLGRRVLLWTAWSTMKTPCQKNVSSLESHLLNMSEIRSGRQVLSEDVRRAKDEIIEVTEGWVKPTKEVTPWLYQIIIIFFYLFKLEPLSFLQRMHSLVGLLWQPASQVKFRYPESYWYSLNVYS